jgi:hypothetical protein
MGDIGAHPARHHAGEVSGELGTQAAAAMWRRRNSELKGKREEDGKRTEGKVPNQRSMHGFKGDMSDSSSSTPGPPCQQDICPLVRASR